MTPAALLQQLNTAHRLENLWQENEKLRDKLEQRFRLSSQRRAAFDKKLPE